MKKVVQITSGKGPAECGLAVALALQEFINECLKKNIKHQIVETVYDDLPGTFQSVTIELNQNTPDEFLHSWIGNILWICDSPFRKNHKRKNWFIGVSIHETKEKIEFNESEITFSTMKASGPGGQHVNKTLSAVRATYLPLGITVTSSESRSQHENKKLAIERLKNEFNKLNEKQKHELRKARHREHQELERGNPVRTYRGLKFIRS